MYARNIQVRAALLAVIALAVIAAFSASASAATSFVCPQNVYSSCFEQPSAQAAHVTVVQKLRHRAAKKHRSKHCPTSNPYANLIYCR